MLGQGNDGWPLHVICAPKAKYLAIITLYRQSPKAWADDFRTEKQA
jgi:hypothetical protein